MDNSYKPDSILEFEKEHGIILENRIRRDLFYDSPNSFQLDENGEVICLNTGKIKSLNKICLFPFLRTLNLSGALITKIEGINGLIELTTLNLSETQVSKIEGLENLINLTFLNLSKTQISKLEGLENLVNLTCLDLSRTEISKIEGLENLINLSFLYLSWTQISKLEGLENLANLIWLDLSRTQISKIEGLEKLVALSWVNLSWTSISKIEGLENLINLTNLYLSWTSISKIEGLGNLVNLTSLYLSGDSISKIEGLENLLNLTRLDLSWTQISKIEGLENLVKLTSLNLSWTSIAKIEDIDNLTSLVELNLSGAKIKKIEENDISHLVRLETLYIDSNPFLFDNDIILTESQNHKDDILNFIDEQKEEKISFEYPYKVMLLGNHGAGKSSFLKCYDRAYKYKGSTHILQIFKSLKKGSPKVIFYDFGGQDYYHGIYQAFFTNQTLNLLFWNDKTDHNKRATDRDGISILNFNRLYWLSQIRYASQRVAQSYQKYENNTFLVQTHADTDRQKTLGSDFIGKEVANIVNEEFFVALACDKTIVREEKEGYAHAVSYLKSRLNSIVNSNSREKHYPESQVKLYKEIQKRQQNVGYKYIKVEELLEGYTKDLLKAKLYQLYCKGEILYYRWSRDLENIVWLNPAETVKHIHTILSMESFMEGKGQICEEEMKKVFDKDPKLLHLLSLEKVVFHDEKKKTYIIPNYLPLAEEDEAYSWLTLGFMSPNFTLKFESFIHFGLINQLICYYGGGGE